MAEIDRLFPDADARRRTLAGIDPRVRDRFERLMAEASRVAGWTPYISSVTRTPTEQAQSASDIACSWHLFGRAIDLDIGPRDKHPDVYEEIEFWWTSRPADRYGKGWAKLYDNWIHLQWAPTVSARPACEGFADLDAAQLAWWSKLRRPGGGTRGNGLVAAAGVLAVIALGLWLVRRRRS